MPPKLEEDSTNTQANNPEEKPLIPKDPAEEEKKKPLFLGLFPLHAKNLCLISLFDISVTTAVCRDVFFTSCLTRVTPRLLCLLILRLCLIGGTGYGAYIDNT